MKHIINKLSALILMLMCVSATVQAEMVSHAVCEPTYGTRGYTRECWEDTETGKFYADEARTQELTGLALAKAITYAKLPKNPINRNFTFDGPNDEQLEINGETLDLNWAVSTTFKHNSNYLDRVTRSVRFEILNENIEYVSNARIVLFSEINSKDYKYYSVSFTIIRDGHNETGQTVYGEDANGVYVFNLGRDVKKGDIVEFSVIQESASALSFSKIDATFKASLEYTFINESDIEYHTTCAPTFTSRGFTRECWENKITGQIYANADLTQEIVDKNLAQAVTYLPLRENPSGNTSEFYKSNYDRMFDVDMYWNSFCEYEFDQDNIHSTPRYAEFKVTADNVSNARLVWYRYQQGWQHAVNSGGYVVKVYVNNVAKYYKDIPPTQDNSEAIYVVPLPELKKGDIVKYQVVQTYQALYGDYFRASLEYIGKFANDDYLVCYPIQESTEDTYCVKSECWENINTGRFYTNAACFEEMDGLEIAKTIIYPKRTNLIVATNGFTQSEHERDWEVDLNWAGVTSYSRGLSSAPRWVDFKASTTKDQHKIANARLVWNKNQGDGFQKGTYNIKIYVNGEEVYNKQQIKRDFFEGVFVKLLPNLKKNDIVRFQVTQSEKANDVGATFKASLEYNVVPCTEHEYAASSAVCSLCGHVNEGAQINVVCIDAEDNNHLFCYDKEASDNTFTLTDGCKQLAIYEDIPMQTLTYKRSFSAANTWQALYVPFEMEYDDWKDNFDVAAISNFHEYTDENGVTESIELEVRYVKGGKLRANTPYLIRAKAAGVQTIVLNDVTLMATESKSIDCSSTERRYTFTGTYDAIDGLNTKDYIFLSGGRLSKTDSDAAVLKPMRWYLTIEDYFSVTGNASPALAKPMMIRMIDDDETTDIENISVVSSPLNAKASGIFSITGAKLTKLQRGINIVNGKKIVVK